MLKLINNNFRIDSSDECINILLSPPQSLVNQCLLQEDFQKASNVIEVSLFKLFIIIMKEFHVT